MVDMPPTMLTKLKYIQILIIVDKRLLNDFL